MRRLSAAALLFHRRCFPPPPRLPLLWPPAQACRGRGHLLLLCAAEALSVEPLSTVRSKTIPSFLLRLFDLSFDVQVPSESSFVNPIGCALDVWRGFFFYFHPPNSFSSITLLLILSHPFVLRSYRSIQRIVLSSSGAVSWSFLSLLFPPFRKRNLFLSLCYRFLLYSCHRRLISGRRTLVTDHTTLFRACFQFSSHACDSSSLPIRRDLSPFSFLIPTPTWRPKFFLQSLVLLYYLRQFAPPPLPFSPLPFLVTRP